MKIYIFTDTHGSPSDLEYVRKKSKGSDLILCGGDFTIFENEIEYVMEHMNMLPSKTILIHGNHEDELSVRLLAQHFENLKYLHMEIYEYKDIIIVAYGGGGFATNDLLFEKWTKKIKKQIKGKKIILMTHGPPYGTKTDKMALGYVGNKSYTKFIKEFQPVLAICGHIHETFGKRDKIGKTKIINPGPKGEMIEI